MPITVQTCSTYPIKSLGGFNVDQMETTLRGPKNDRLYKLIDAQRKFVTQRQYAALATITTEFNAQGLLLSAPDKPSLNLTPDVITSQLVTTQIWNDKCEAYVADAATNAWFSDILKKPVQLVRLADEKKRPTDPQYSQAGDEVSFADGFPFLITTQASLDFLKPHFKNAAEIDMSRFRPNIVLAGNAPFAEDIWHHIRIGKAEFEIVKPCGRCGVTKIDQTSGKKTSEEPLATLKELRHGEEGYYFGANAIPRKLGKIKVGDRVEILSTQPLPSLLIPTKINALNLSLAA